MIEVWSYIGAIPNFRAVRRVAAVSIVCGLIFAIDVGGPYCVQADTKVIPTAILSERYDTNVFYAPPELLPPGQRRSDFVSTLAGGLQLLHKSRAVEASLTGGADANAYAYNTGLNFFSTTADAYVRLDGWAGQFVDGAKLLIAEGFRYTPEQPSFFTGTKAQTLDDPFLRGIQGFRANTFSNTTSATGELPIFRGLALQSSYSYSLYRVGSIVALTSTGAAFFDTNIHTWSVGPGIRLSPVDHLALSYQQSLVSQKLTNSGPGISQDLAYNAQEVSAKYTRIMPDWTAVVQAGATLIEPASQAFPSAALTVTSDPERSTSFRLDLSRRAAPSYFFAAGSTISNVAQVAVAHRLSKRLTLRGSFSYGYNEIVPGKTITFENLSGLAGLNYNLTRTMSVDLSYNYNNFTIKQPGTPFEVQRDVVMLSLTSRWK
ncbi:MAG: hypothetical protein E6R14_02250 [Thermomicrobiales bacterium]|nr:MAG: hypothetical protein E6R14_02250 [Thermomicrobiales bacterium]